MQPIEIFFSYSHKDELLRDELAKHLVSLRRAEIITDWHDRRILPGQKWDKEIDSHLNTADIILLLISPDFMASDYCYGVEVKRAVERYERGEARVIPVILRDIYWQDAPFGKIQALPKDALPVTSWPNQDKAFFNVAAGIREVVKDLKEKRFAAFANTTEQSVSSVEDHPPKLDPNIDISKNKKSESIRAVSSSPSLPLLTQDKELLPASTGKQFQLKDTLSGHSMAVRSVALSADGKTIVSGSDDNTIKVWDLQTSKLPRTLDHSVESLYPYGVLAIATSPDGKTIVSGSDDNTIKVWNLETKKLLHTLTDHKNWVNGVAISRDGKTIVSGSLDKTLKIWNLETGKLPRTLKGHEESVNGVAISEDGKTIVSGSDDKTVRVWNLETGKLLRTLKDHKGSVNGVAISEDGKMIVSGSDDETVKVWNLETGKLLRTLLGHEHGVNGVAISGDGKTIVSGSSYRVMVWAWELEIGALLQTLKDHNGVVNGVAISRDGKTIVSGSADKMVRVWSLQA